jgi:hypothetical protein
MHSLQQAFPDIDNDGPFKKIYNQVVSTIVVAKKPLAITAIAELYKINVDSVKHLLGDLGCVISMEWEGGVLVAHIIHSSFLGFITNSTRCKSMAFFIDHVQASQMIALSSLNIMKTRLKFNICELETSYICNDNVPNLKSSIETVIPVHLSYSCCFWGYHVKDTPFSEILLREISSFLKEYLLYWLETLSLLKSVSVALQTLPIIIEWTEVSYALSMSCLESNMDLFRLMIQKQ